METILNLLNKLNKMESFQKVIIFFISFFFLSVLRVPPIFSLAILALVFLNPMFVKELLIKGKDKTQELVKEVKEELNLNNEDEREIERFKKENDLLYLLMCRIKEKNIQPTKKEYRGGSDAEFLYEFPEQKISLSISDCWDDFDGQKSLLLRYESESTRQIGTIEYPLKNKFKDDEVICFFVKEKEDFVKRQSDHIKDQEIEKIKDL